MHEDKLNPGNYFFLTPNERQQLFGLLWLMRCSYPYHENIEDAVGTLQNMLMYTDGSVERLVPTPPVSRPLEGYRLLLNPSEGWMNGE